MTSRISVRSLFVALLTWAAIAAEPTTQRPNFVVFIADDHTAIDSEPYGSTEVRTPQRYVVRHRAGKDMGYRAQSKADWTTA